MLKEVIDFRTCYGHLAGKKGVLITNVLIKKGYIQLDEDQFVVTDSGKIFFQQFNIDPDILCSQNKNFSKACLDGSEKIPHLGGSLGSTFCTALINDGWLKKKTDSRAMIITEKGKKKLKEYLGIVF